MNTASTVMELIRKHNSDYFEQYLFLRAREHLMAVQESTQQQNGKDDECQDCRPELEAAMDEIMSKCGLVNLGTLISAICDHLHLLQERLRRPHSSVSSTASSLH
jgi:serine/threonine-protein phosphatase 6 regulatory subunit 3